MHILTPPPTPPPLLNSSFKTLAYKCIKSQLQAFPSCKNYNLINNIQSTHIQSHTEHAPSGNKERPTSYMGVFTNPHHHLGHKPTPKGSAFSIYKKNYLVTNQLYLKCDPYWRDLLVFKQAEMVQFTFFNDDFLISKPNNPWMLTFPALR